MNFFRGKVHYVTQHWLEKKQQVYPCCGFVAPARSAKGRQSTVLSLKILELWRKPKKTCDYFHKVFQQSPNRICIPYFCHLRELCIVLYGNKILYGQQKPLQFLHITVSNLKNDNDELKCYVSYRSADRHIVWSFWRQLTAWHVGYSRLNEKIFDSTNKSRLEEKNLDWLSEFDSKK